MQKWKLLNLGHGFWPKFKARTLFVRSTASIRKKKNWEKKTLSVVSYLNKMLHFALWFTWHEFSSLICEIILCSYSLYCNPIASIMFIQKICLTFLFKFLLPFSNKWKGKLAMCIYNNGILTGGLEFLVFLPCLL